MKNKLRLKVENFNFYYDKFQALNFFKINKQNERFD